MTLGVGIIKQNGRTEFREFIRVSTIQDVAQLLETLAPLGLAEEWDNVGLLVGDTATELYRVMTCLTLTPDVAEEAIDKRVELIVSHHPILFRPVQRLTADSYDGRMLLELIAACVAVYSPHTGYDSAKEGINQQLAELFGLCDVAPLRLPKTVDHDSADATSESVGSGRFGRLPEPIPLAEFNRLVKRLLHLDTLQFVGDEQAMVEGVGIACGSAAEFLPDAVRNNCQVLLTGEARFHSALEAAGLGTNLVLVGHYASERPAVERLAEMIAAGLPHLTVWPSESESDPLQWA